MKKLLAVSLAVFLASPSWAGIAARSPKEHLDLNYTLNFGTACTSAGALYAIILSTGNAAADYTICKDSAPTVNTMTVVSNTASIGPRIYNSSSTAVSGLGLPSNGNINFVYDPPLLFFNGLTCATNSASDAATVIYECGRGLTGN